MKYDSTIEKGAFGGQKTKVCEIDDNVIFGTSATHSADNDNVLEVINYNLCILMF